MAIALKFPGLHKTIRNFVNTGLLNGEDGYAKASKALEMTKLRAKYGIGPIKTRIGEALENFTRPVNWVLWGELAKIAMVIIPEEAELVIPLLRAAETPRVHLLLYAAPHLMYYDYPMLPAGWKAPLWPPFELGILAGRLYFNFSDYDGLLEKLCPAGYGNDDDQSSSLDTQNVLAFLNEWLALRRQGQDIAHTPMGYICHDRHLRSGHPFFMQRTIDTTSEQDQHHVVKDKGEEDGDYESEYESEGCVETVTEDVL
ncbi:hypothetical protein UA08_04823 [Talaromyces atroroseus]|uniref:Uncharacterized protein n=1 Tax=Talaromyces atroroseus TaxID=1441469 RepID=A0A225ARQ1_TALAT|nr:hypothetical protein UA08_04823 [Talaromyces atroroseus]OKL59958.1 hypothetical protein UA08_04823 [Talaromyces atroroseus]